jgi:uroporphyrinogen-III decarboxylase
MRPPPHVCSPGTYREYALPYERRLIRRLRAAGVPVALHICGDATRTADDMVATGADVLELDYNHADVRRGFSGRG